MRRHFHALRPVNVPHEDDRAVPEPPRPQTRAGRCRVCVLGAIGVHKGYDILLACARDAAERRLKLDFVVVGHTIDDARLLATGQVFITGRYEQDEAVLLMRRQDASLALLPSIWPETWSFGLDRSLARRSDAWRRSTSALRPSASATPAAASCCRWACRRSGINNALLAAVGLSGHERV